MVELLRLRQINPPNGINTSQGPRNLVLVKHQVLLIKKGKSSVRLLSEACCCCGPLVPTPAAGIPACACIHILYPVAARCYAGSASPYYQQKSRQWYVYAILVIV